VPSLGKGVPSSAGSETCAPDSADDVRDDKSRSAPLAQRTPATRRRFRGGVWQGLPKTSLVEPPTTPGTLTKSSARKEDPEDVALK